MGGTIIFLLYGKHAPEVLLGFGFGGTLLAMFMRVGGGIYTKAADVGADLVGKVEAGLPEDDPRNAAAIADLVGDNVGDFSGMAEDVFESYEVTIVSAMILGLAVMQLDPTHSLKWIVFPLLVRAIGVFSSIIGTYAVSMWPTKGDAFRAMDLSYDLSSIISTVSFFFLAVYYAKDMRLFAATAAGILLAVGFNKYTALFTERETPSVNRIVKSAKTGSATSHPGWIGSWLRKYSLGSIDHCYGYPPVGWYLHSHHSGSPGDDNNCRIGDCRSNTGHLSGHQIQKNRKWHLRSCWGRSGWFDHQQL